MDEWIDRLAAALGEDPVEPREMGVVLKVARDVAHGVERKLAPVSAYLLGVRAGRSMSGGGSRLEALEWAAGAARAMIPGPDRAEREEDAAGGAADDPSGASADSSGPSGPS